MLKKCLFSLALCLLPVAVSAQGAVLADVVATVERPFRQDNQSSGLIRNFTAEFLQESHIASINRTQHGAGTVSFKFETAPGNPDPRAQFRWDYSRPMEQQIISDGATMWVYVPENRQVIESRLDSLQHQGDNPAMFLSSLGNLSRDFVVAWGADKVTADGNYLLLLTPRQPSPLIRRLTLEISRAAVTDWRDRHESGKVFPVVATQVTDQQGNRTTIRFERIKVNVKLRPDLFSFARPADVELVHPDQLTF